MLNRRSELPGHYLPPDGKAYSADSNLLITARSGGKVYVHELGSGTIASTAVIGQVDSEYVQSVSLCAGDDLLLLGGLDYCEVRDDPRSEPLHPVLSSGFVALLERRGGRVVCGFNVPGLNVAAASPSGEWIATHRKNEPSCEGGRCGGSRLQVWRAEPTAEGSLPPLREEIQAVWPIGFIPGSDTLAYFSGDDLMVYDCASGVSRLVPPVGEVSFFGLSLDPTAKPTRPTGLLLEDGSTAVVSSEGQPVELRSLREGGRDRILKDCVARVADCSLCDDGDRLLLSLDCHHLLLYDPASGERLREFRPLDLYETAVLSPCGNLVYRQESHGGVIEIVDASTGETCNKLEGRNPELGTLEDCLCGVLYARSIVATPWGAITDTRASPVLWEITT